MDKKKPALGKGLSALIPDATSTPEAPRATLEVDIDQLEANRYQPRTTYDSERLTDLANSIASSGIIQPIVVRRLADQGGAVRPRYQIIAGERRWRAAQQAGLATIPAIVRETSDGHRLRDALLENIHRAQLNPLEEAAAYQQLLDEFDVTHEELAGRIGRSRPVISNMIRLLRLPIPVQRRVAAGVLSAGHARAHRGRANAAGPRARRRSRVDFPPSARSFPGICPSPPSSTGSAPRSRPTSTTPGRPSRSCRN